ncbi:peptide-methionine (R)-S-oxide reductase [Aureococcus anophagefferens]|nr:peptide-methionine (R)-S-oxide reductase [Aureococcus anophagefferens]
MLAVAFLARGVRAFAPRAKPTRLVGRALAAGGDMPADDEGWRTELSPNQFAVLRNKATEPAGFSETTEGELEHELKKDGTLYYARAKFDSGCGWPAFYDGVPGAIEEVPDVDGYRVEIVCAKCKGHLGHVFKGEGFPSPTDARHCVNGISLRYQPTSYQPDDVEALPAQFVPRADPSGLS